MIKFNGQLIEVETHVNGGSLNKSDHYILCNESMSYILSTAKSFSASASQTFLRQSVSVDTMRSKTTESCSRDTLQLEMDV